jgi:hypothetical protein
MKPLNALKTGDRWDFVLSEQPRCPHCGDLYDIHENEAWSLYDMQRDSNDVICMGCDLLFTVKTEATYSFSTDEQDSEDE